MHVMDVSPSVIIIEAGDWCVFLASLSRWGDADDVGEGAGMRRRNDDDEFSAGMLGMDACVEGACVDG
jgi:hypothetical protein